MDSGHHGLVVTIEEVLYPISDQVIHQVFDSYGKFEILDVFSLRNDDIQAFIWFQFSWSAMAANISLQGRSIYTGGCHLNIEFYNQNVSTPSPTTHADMVFDVSPKRTETKIQEKEGHNLWLSLQGKIERIDSKLEARMGCINRLVLETREEGIQGCVESKIQVPAAPNKSGQPKFIEEVAPLEMPKFIEEGIGIVMVFDEMPERTDGNFRENKGSEKEEMKQEGTEAKFQFPITSTVSSPNAFQLLTQSPFPPEPSPQGPLSFEHFTAVVEHRKLIEKCVEVTTYSLAAFTPYPYCFSMILPPPRPPSKPPYSFQISGNPYILSVLVEIQEVLVGTEMILGDEEHTNESDVINCGAVYANVAIGDESYGAENEEVKMSENGAANAIIGYEVGASCFIVANNRNVDIAGQKDATVASNRNEKIAGDTVSKNGLLQIIANDPFYDAIKSVLVNDKRQLILAVGFSIYKAIVEFDCCLMVLKFPPKCVAGCEVGMLVLISQDNCVDEMKVHWLRKGVG